MGSGKLRQMYKPKPTLFRKVAYRSRTEAWLASFLEIVAPSRTYHVEYEPGDCLYDNWRPDFIIAAAPHGVDLRNPGDIQFRWSIDIEVKATDRELDAVKGKLIQARYDTLDVMDNGILGVSVEGMTRGSPKTFFWPPYGSGVYSLEAKGLPESPPKEMARELYGMLFNRRADWWEAVRLIELEGKDTTAPPADWVKGIKERQARKRAAEECRETHIRDYDDGLHTCPECGERMNCAYESCYDCAREP